MMAWPPANGVMKRYKTSHRNQASMRQVFFYLRQADFKDMRITAP